MHKKRCFSVSMVQNENRWQNQDFKKSILKRQPDSDMNTGIFMICARTVFRCVIVAVSTIPFLNTCLSIPDDGSQQQTSEVTEHLPQLSDHVDIDKRDDRRVQTQIHEPLRSITIMLDPGHGGLNTGAYSYSDIPEKIFNNHLVKAVSESLIGKGFHVIFTRRPDRDIYVAPDERAKMANQLKPDLFLSIHHNKDFFDSRTRGYSIYYSSYKPDLDNEDIYLTVNGRIYHGFIEEKTVNNLTRVYYRDNGRIRSVNKYEAEFYVYDRTLCPVAVESSEIASALAESFSNLKSIHPFKGIPVEEKDFIVLRKSQTPSVLIEAGYISNREEETVLSRRSTRKEIALCIANALEEFYITKLQRPRITKVITAEAK